VTGSNESRKEVGGQKNEKLSAKYITEIGIWNVRTACSTGKLVQIIKYQISFAIVIDLG